MLEHDGIGALPRANVSVKVSALTPLLRPDAPERRRARCRRAAACRCSRARTRARRTHPHRHGVAGLTRGGAGARAGAAGRAGVRATGPRSGSCSRPTCATRPSSSSRSWAGLAPSAHARRSGPARQGRLLGPRAGRGPPAGLAGAGVRGQGRLRPQLRGADPARCSTPGPAVRVAVASHNLRSVSHAIAYNRAARRRGSGSGAAGAARARRRAPGRAGRERLPGPDLLPGGRPGGRMAYLVRRLLENTSNEIFLHEQAQRTSAGGAAGGAVRRTARRRAATRALRYWSARWLWPRYWAEHSAGGPDDSPRGERQGRPTSDQPVHLWPELRRSRLATAIQLPVNRWGGDTTDSYNWRLGSYQEGADYYFENLSDCFLEPGPCVPAYRKFISDDRARRHQDAAQPATRRMMWPRTRRGSIRSHAGSR